VRLRDFGTALLLALLLGALPGPTSGYSYVSTRMGFDTCAAPTQASMQTWWTRTPYWVAAIYAGGANRGCAQPNLTAAWIDAIEAQGWALLPIWFGPQLPSTCSGQSWKTTISLTATTARNQGIAEATAAFNAARALGMNTSKVPLIYDLEGYGGGAGCRAAAKAFIDGWSDYLFKEPGETFGVDAKPGVYGSACASYLDDFWSISNRPVFTWFAWWNGNKSTSNTPACLNGSHWAGQLRHKQYSTAPHNETWGGVTIHIDNDCSYGPAYKSAAQLGGDCG
jgi:hypothetical protein